MVEGMNQWLKAEVLLDLCELRFLFLFQKHMLISSIVKISF